MRASATDVAPAAVTYMAPPAPEESRYSFANLKKRHERRLLHLPDFHPSLPAIQSDSSEEEREEEEYEIRRNLLLANASRRRSGRVSETHRRESCDDLVSRYLLSLAREAVEKHMADVKAANRMHTSRPSSRAPSRRNSAASLSEHSRDRDRDNDNRTLVDNVCIYDDPQEVANKFRRDSLVDIGNEIAVLRQVKEEHERRARERKMHRTAEQIRKDQEEEEQRIVKQAIRRKEALELEKLKALEPPMMGDDIVFPQCMSPQTVACTPDQLPQPGYFRLDEHPQPASGDVSPLWQRSLSPASTRPSSTTKLAGPGGLWNGLCKKQNGALGSSSSLSAGWMTPAIMTPVMEHSDPFLQPPHGMHGMHGVHSHHGHMPPYSSMLHMPYTPPESNPTTPPPEGLDMMMLDSPASGLRRKSLQSVEDRELRIQSEFPDSFVSQIYDYLSLGYPSLARSFDRELSKISKMPLDWLRSDDEHVNAQGYVVPPLPSPKPEECFSLRRFPNRGVGATTVDFDELIRQRRCMRWCALRLYIHEWARQQSSWLDDDRDRDGLLRLKGLPAPPRKGSWAV
ncbi:hypothetical protein KEM52_001485 [Ascosphaera acerosa]|nr:hypothetical protein KEM52_001485 [Ascosphaera acerosa]